MAFRMDTYGAGLVQTCKPTGTQSIMRPEAPFIKSISLGLFENRKPLKTGAFEQFFKLFPLIPASFDLNNLAAVI